MAIQKNITDRYGTEHAEAYVKIEQVLLRFDTAETEIYISVYHNAASRSRSDASARKIPFISSMLRISEDDADTYFTDSVLYDNAKSPLKQAYAWLKTQTSVFGQNWTREIIDV